MLEIGLTGGIGSGKSTVSAMLAERGAVIFDSDATVRRLQEPGNPVFNEIVGRWGRAVLSEDGRLDRQALAGIVFSDRTELEALNAIVHPAHAEAVARRREGYLGSNQILVYDIPLLAEVGRGGFDGVVVVDVEPEVALSRIVAGRGLEEADVRRRMANQAGRSERLSLADFVISNAGSLGDLRAEVDRCWAWITGLEAPTTDHQPS